MRTLDPSEKGAISYFLGLIFCKLFAAKLLNTPWLLHLDVFRPQLNSVLTGRSRPDLVGQEEATGRWRAFECKGRISAPNSVAKAKAKQQAERLVSVDGVECDLHVGAVTFFTNDALTFYWCDPEPRRAAPIEISVNAEYWRFYFAPVVEALRQAPTEVRATDRTIRFEGADVEIEVLESVARQLLAGHWQGARDAAREGVGDVGGGYNADGIRVKAGRSWLTSFDEGLFVPANHE